MKITSDFAFLGNLRNAEQQPVQLLLLRDAIYVERGYATVRRMSVCLSVCLSVCDFQVL